MKATACLIATIALRVVDSRCSLGQEYLEPERGTLNGYGWEVEYDFYIKKGILENSSALPLVRMVCLPSFSKEWAVSVIAGKRTGHCVVELAVADEQIWGRIQEQKINVKGEGIEAAVMKIGIIENSSIY